MEPAIQRRALRRVVFAAIALVVLLSVGTAGYRVIEGMSTVDALYMAVITLSTVGFGETQPLSPTGRVFTIGLIVAGGGLAALTLSGVAEFVLSGEWRARWEERRRLRMMAHLSDHTIICGYGRVGRHIAHGLRAEGLPFVVIDPSPEKRAHIEEAGYLALLGDAAHDINLQEAGISRARALVAAANTDAENVFIVLTARSLRPDLLILARANYEESEPKLLRAGADRVILPYSITARRMVTMLVRPVVADFLDEVAYATGMELLLEQVEIAAPSILVGQTLAQAQLSNRLSITVLAYKPAGGALQQSPSADTVLEAGGKIIGLGTREQLQALTKLAQG